MKLEQINGGEFRSYRYDAEDGTPPVDLLSVTSIRSLCGEGFQLVAWKLANLADAALGTMKQTVIGPRGGVSEKRQVFEFPSAFVSDYLETAGAQTAIDDLRKRLRASADEPRALASRRGSIVHVAIERNVAWDRIERPYVESAFADLSARDRAVATDADVAFIRAAVRQYADMRRQVRFVLIAREVRVVNLAAGYAGTFDALAWLLPDGVTTDITADRVTVEDVERVGGKVVLLDWKTSKDVHTDSVVQVHAYLAAEFAVVNGERDERVTNLLTAATAGGIVHIRPNKWGLYLFDFNAEVVQAFLGSLVFARLLARHKEPTALFTESFEGRSEEADDAP